MQHDGTRARLAATFALALAALLLPAASATAATTTIGRLAPNPYVYNPPYYEYHPPEALCHAPEDLLQPTVSAGTAYVVPANGTSIGSWSTNATTGAGQEMTLKVFRKTTGSSYEVVGHDGPRTLAAGTSTGGSVNTFSGLSLAVQPGDVIGLYPANANSVPSACMFAAGGNGYLHAATNLADGASGPFSAASGDLLNVTATVQVTGGPAQHTLTVNTTGSGTGSVQSSPAGIEACAFSCSQAFGDGTYVTLTASPGSYSTFSGWSGGGCSGTGPCSVIVGPDVTVTATFATQAYSYESGNGYNSGYGPGSYTTPGGGAQGGGATAGKNCPKARATKKKHRKPKCGKRTKTVVKEARNQGLGKRILTTTRGRTLYSLSVETHGQFTCTGGCLSTWHPLTVPAGVTPTGPVRLATVRRPEGSTQVTYRGRPLYTFAGDTAPGETNGQGFTDVGTWEAAPAPGG